MEEATIVKGIPMPKALIPGRPKGSGPNMRLLRKLEPGNPHHCIWSVSKNKMNSLKWSAYNSGLTLRIRKLEDGTYSIWRFS